jgi:glycerophosphoryl diester phosphodiesterase
MPLLRKAAMAAVLLCVLSMSASAVEIIGHRGASADAPENTVASEKLGYRQGADGGELDIHLTKDGRIVVIHDYDTKRVAGVDRKVVDQTFAEIRKLNVGAWGDWRGKGFNEKVPTLDEILAIVPKGKKIYIEIKVKSEILPALADSLKKAALSPDQTPIITFYLDVAEAAKKQFPDLKVYWLYDWKQDKQTGKYPDLDELIAKAKQAKLDGLDLNHNFPLDAANIRKIHEAGLEIGVWTLDDPAKARQLAKDGVDAITTNKPGMMKQALKASE